MATTSMCPAHTHLRQLLMLPLLALLLAAPHPARATEVIALDEDTLVARSETIVHGRVTARTCHRSDDGRIFTEYRLEVLETIRGPARPGEQLVFREWGGEIDGLHYWIPGTGRLETGEEAIVFLPPRASPAEIGFTTGLAQGKWHVERGADGRARVRQRLGALVLRSPDRSGRPVAAPRARPLDLERALEGLRARVRALRGR